MKLFHALCSLLLAKDSFNLPLWFEGIKKSQKEITFKTERTVKLSLPRWHLSLKLRQPVVRPQIGTVGESTYRCGINSEWIGKRWQFWELKVFALGYHAQYSWPDHRNDKLLTENISHAR
jgi:hypothetical protein